MSAEVQELEGLLLEVGEREVEIRRSPGPSDGEVAPAALFFIGCLFGGIAMPIGLAFGGDWETMTALQRTTGVVVAVTMQGFALYFAWMLFLVADRSFAIRVGAQKLSLRRHRFSARAIPRARVDGVRVRGELFDSPGQHRLCSVVVELSLKDERRPVRLFRVGRKRKPIRDTPAQRERLATAAMVLARAIAEPLGVPTSWTAFQER